MAKSSKPKILNNKGKSPLMGVGSSASKKNTAVLGQTPPQKRDYSKNKLPEQAFEIPGFGDTGMTGES